MTITFLFIASQDICRRQTGELVLAWLGDYATPKWKESLRLPESRRNLLAQWLSAIFSLGGVFVRLY